MFQGTRKSPANGWAQSGLGYKRDYMNSHPSCYLDEIRNQTFN